MPGNVEQIRDALQCANPSCRCHAARGRLHCPSHSDTNPDLSLKEKDGVVLVHCFAGCTQDAVIEALRARGLWEGTPSPSVRAEEARDLFFAVLAFLTSYVVFPSQAATIAVVLWILHCWVLVAFEVTPYLLIKSPTVLTGKTRLLEVLELILPHPW